MPSKVRNREVSGKIQETEGSSLGGEREGKRRKKDISEKVVKTEKTISEKVVKTEKTVLVKSTEAKKGKGVGKEEIGGKKLAAGSKKRISRKDEEKEGAAEGELEGLQEFMPLEAGSGLPIPSRKKGKQLSSIEYPETLGTPQKPNVLFISRIPHGFYEDQMMGFFGQFGDITRLRLSRNKKTGKSKHYAFLEFRSAEVAAVVAECMEGYLLFGSVLRCRLVPPEKIHPLMWIGANRKFRLIPFKKIAKERHNKERGPEEQRKQLRNLLKKDQKRRKRLMALGIDYDFESLSKQVPQRPTHKIFRDESN